MGFYACVALFRSAVGTFRRRGFGGSRASPLLYALGSILVEVVDILMSRYSPSMSTLFYELEYADEWRPAEVGWKDCGVTATSLNSSLIHDQLFMR
jgi:hypothetical protein